MYLYLFHFLFGHFLKYILTVLSSYGQSLSVDESDLPTVEMAYFIQCHKKGSMDTDKAGGRQQGLDAFQIHAGEHIMFSGAEYFGVIFHSLYIQDLIQWNTDVVVFLLHNQSTWGHFCFSPKKGHSADGFPYRSLEPFVGEWFVKKIHGIQFKNPPRHIPYKLL